MRGDAVGGRDELLTLGEAARRHGLSRALLSRWVDECRLSRVTDLVGRRRVYAGELHAFLSDDENHTRREVAELESAYAELHRLRQLARWLVSLDGPGREMERGRVTLRLVIDRARESLAVPDESETRGE